AAAILPTNGRRIVRALEVIELSGRPFSATLPDYDQGRPVVQLGLHLPRPELDRRIKARVDRMWESGFEAEARALAGLRAGGTAGAALGDPEVSSDVGGCSTLARARAVPVRASSRSARRQESWFRRYPSITWLPAEGPAEELTVRALSVFTILLNERLVPPV